MAVLSIANEQSSQRHTLAGRAKARFHQPLVGILFMGRCHVTFLAFIATSGLYRIILPFFKRICKNRFRILSRVAQNPPLGRLCTCGDVLPLQDM